jgi:hypothetical protein
MKLCLPCWVLALVLCAGFLAAGTRDAKAQDKLDLALAAGPSPYDLSGTGTGASGAVFLTWRPLSGLVLEPGVTVFRYLSQFDERTSLLFPELSVQAEVPGGRFHPFLGGGGGGAFVLGGTGETVATLHAVGGARIDIGDVWGMRGEMRIRAVHPWTGNTVDLLLGITRTLR